MLTHIHLDHAGGAGALMRELPRARLSVHPRGVRHMVNPAQLFASVSRVYGAQKTHALYGDVLPIDPQRIVPTAQDGHVELAGRRFDFYETPGHAAHHVAIHDLQSAHVFAGDSYGLSYRELDVGDRQFVFPTTSPVQFDPQAYHRSIDLIAGLASDAGQGARWRGCPRVPISVRSAIARRPRRADLVTSLMRRSRTTTHDRRSQATRRTRATAP